MHLIKAKRIKKLTSTRQNKNSFPKVKTTQSPNLRTRAKNHQCPKKNHRARTRTNTPKYRIARLKHQRLNTSRKRPIRQTTFALPIYCKRQITKRIGRIQPRSTAGQLSAIKYRMHWRVYSDHWRRQKYKTGFR